MPEDSDMLDRDTTLASSHNAPSGMLGTELLTAHNFRPDRGASRQNAGLATTPDVLQLSQVDPTQDPLILDQALHQLHHSMSESSMQLGLGEPAVWGAAVDVLAQLAAMRPAEFTKAKRSAGLRGVAASIVDGFASTSPETYDWAAPNISRGGRVARTAKIKVNLVPAERVPPRLQSAEPTSGGKPPQIYFGVSAELKGHSESQTGTFELSYGEPTAFVPVHSATGTRWSGASSSGRGGRARMHNYDDPGSSAIATYSSQDGVTSDIKWYNNARWARDRFERI